LKFASRVKELKPSDIQEMFKVIAKPEVISFASGVPDPDLFPVKEIDEITSKIIRQNGDMALQYNTTEGYVPLRKKIALRMKYNGVESSSENIIITSGAQQGLELSAKLFLNKGDAVICESPTYSGAINAFKSYSPEFIQITTDKNGMKMDELKKVLETRNNIKMIYVITDFQNPTGKSWSVERRKELIELSKSYDIPIIEDSAYEEIYFTDNKKPTLKSLDTGGRVIYLGSFSKTFCPGLRMGWIEVKKSILKNYITLKQSSDMHTNILAQMQIDKYLELYDFDAHIDNIISSYKNKRDKMINAIKKYFPSSCSHTYPEGGMFIWVVMPDKLDGRKVLDEALKENVAFIPGESFYPDRETKNTFRLNFSNAEESKIEKGIEKLAVVLKRVIDNVY